MELKDKLMTLEDFKAVRDVDVASNSAQFTEIKADLGAQVAVLNSNVITDDIRNAILHCFEIVAYATEDGKIAYNNLYNALYGFTWEWDSETSDEFMYRHGLIGDATYDDEATIKLSAEASNRMSVFTSRYQLPVLDENGERYSGYNLFPVPADAGSVTVEFTPTDGYMVIQQMRFTGDNFIYKYIANSGFETGGKILRPIGTRNSNGLRCNAILLYYKLENDADIVNNPNVKITFHNYFDTWIYEYDSSRASNLTMLKRAATRDGNEPMAGQDNSQKRASFCIDRHRDGQAGIRVENSQNRLDWWLIPVPDEAESVKITPTPATYYTGVVVYSWKEVGDSWVIGNSSGWVQGVNNVQLAEVASGYDHRYISINCKFNESGSSGNPPTGLIVEFS